MKLVLIEPKYLKESVAIISELVNEGRFKITPSAVELVAMDPANVAMVIFKLLSSSFSEYNVEKEIEIGINLNNLKQILKRAKANDILSLELVENRLKIQLKSNTIRTFFLPVIDLEEKEQKIPELSFPVEIKTNSSILMDAIDDADIVGESVSFIAEPKKFTIQAQGELSKASIEVKQDVDTQINMKESGKIKAKYSIEYLKKMVIGGKLAEKVSILFNNDYPLRLDFKAVDKMLLSFILAPRVENE